MLSQGDRRIPADEVDRRIPADEVIGVFPPTS
jgi:hypothetical protein